MDLLGDCNNNHPYRCSLSKNNRTITYPKTTKVAIDSKVYKFELIRTETTNKACLVKLKIPVTNITGKLYYHHFSANEPYDTINMFQKWQ